MDFFSDKELGRKEATVNDISVTVWNGVVAIFESFMSNNSFSKNFPEQCPDNLGIVSCNSTLFYDKLKALVPNIQVPIKRKEDNSIDTFAILDFIEFCFRNLDDAVKRGDWHEFFKHYHLEFTNENREQKRFTEEINSLFERNRIAYNLNRYGEIFRIVPEEFNKIINRNFKTKDSTLNELLNEATKYFLLPKPNDRIRAVEKIWDAFERAKTFYGTDKKIASSQLLKVVANGNTLFETYLTIESTNLTDIGNKFQIRHFETGKQPITDIVHIDYLFYRMFSLIDLFIKELEK